MSDLTQAVRDAIGYPYAIVQPGPKEHTFDVMTRAVMATIDQARSLTHIPTIVEGSTPGVWMVHCVACSHHAQDYVYPCTAGRWEAPRQLVAAHRLEEAHGVLGAWEKAGEAIAHHIPEHYEAGEGSFMGLVQDWANDAAAVVDAGQAWRKNGRGPVDGDLLADAVEKIYPSEDYL